MAVQAHSESHKITGRQAVFQSGAYGHGGTAALGPMQLNEMHTGNFIYRAGTAAIHQLLAFYPAIRIASVKPQLHILEHLAKERPSFEIEALLEAERELQG